MILEKLHVVLNADSNKLIARTYNSASVMSGENGSATVLPVGLGL